MQAQIRILAKLAGIKIRFRDLWETLVHGQWETVGSDLKTLNRLERILSARINHNDL